MSIAVEAGSTTSDCLGSLEQCRGIIMSFVIDCRSDMKDLRLKIREICEKLNSLRIEIDSPLVGDVHGNGYEDRRSRRLRALQQIDET